MNENGEMSKASKIKLGDDVVDTFTGFKGKVISRIEYLTGCIQYGVKAKAREGKIAEPEYIDEIQLEIIKPKKKVETRPSGGIMSDAPKKSRRQK